MRMVASCLSKINLTGNPNIYFPGGKTTHLALVKLGKPNDAKLQGLTHQRMAASCRILNLDVHETQVSMACYPDGLGLFCYCIFTTDKGEGKKGGRMNQVERRYRRKMKISIGLFISALILAILLLIAYLGLNVGHYTIVVSDTYKVLSISEDPTVESGRTTRLNAKKVVDAFHYSADALPNDIDRDNALIGASYNASHNGDNYLAYTFYVKNVGDVKAKYSTEIVATDKVNDIYDFLRVRVYREGVVKTYAKGTSDEAYIKDADGIYTREPRECIGRSTLTHNDDLDKDWNVCSATKPINNQRAEQFVTDDTIMSDMDYIDAQEIVRYTVVIWIEGDDPECVGSPSEDSAAIILSMKMKVIELVRE